MSALTPLAGGPDMDAINPANGDRFSPNLFKWLGKRRGAPIALQRVYRVTGPHTDALYIGYLDNDPPPAGQYLIGSNLNGVLCNGAREQIFAFPVKPTWQPVEIVDFWPRYHRDGRCAIDIEHRTSFVGDDSRWHVNGDTRTCCWCGNAVQTLKRWTETVERSAWVVTA